MRKNRGGLWTGRRLAEVIFRVALVLACAALASCGNVPGAQGIIDRASATAAAPLITGPHGRLSARESAAVFKKAGVPDYLMPHLALTQAVNDDPLTEGNTTRILVDGDATFDTVFHAIENAHDSIDMEFYIFEDVDDGKTSLSDLLLRKRREGVAINIIYDGFGSKDTPSGFFDELREAGVKLVQFNPVSVLETGGRYAPNHRDHRKILVVDGVTGFSGGVNLSTEYENDPGARMGSSPSLKGGWNGMRNVGNDYWHDTDIEIKGPAVAELQRLFFAHWHEQKGPRPDDKDYFPPPEGHGNELIRIVGSKAGKGAPDYYVTLLSALENARKRIWLTAAYFVPTDEEMKALLDAQARGVDVRILVPNRSDSHLAMLMQRAEYPKLLNAGVRIFETRGEVLHSKNVVIDGVWSVIGSSNFDHRSVVFNDEADVVIVGRKTGARLESLFEADCAKAQEILWRNWNCRDMMGRMRDALAPLWLALLKANL